MVLAGRVRAFYNRYPNVAPLAAGVGLFGLADVVANRVENRFSDASVRFDPLRTAAVMGTAPFTNGGVLWFYRGVDAVCAGTSGARSVAQKVAIMTFVWNPVSVVSYTFISTFFYCELTRLMPWASASDPADGAGGVGSAARAAAKVRANFVEAYTASFFLWPVSDALNFTIIQRAFSPHFRSTWDAFIGLIWNTSLLSRDAC